MSSEQEFEDLANREETEQDAQRVDELSLKIDGFPGPMRAAEDELRAALARLDQVNNGR